MVTGKATGLMLYPISFTPKVVEKNSEPAYHLLLASGSHASYANGINKQMLGQKLNGLNGFLFFLLIQLENLKERIEEESEKKSDALKALSKAQAEIQLWRSKYETEGLGRIDELEGSKTKLTSRLAEAEETIDSLNQRISGTEKTKHRLEVELEDLQLEYERVHAAAIISEKRGRNFDKVCLLLRVLPQDK